MNRWLLILALAAAIACGVAIRLWLVADERSAVLSADLANLRSSYKVLEAQKAHVDTILRVQTKTAVQTLMRYDSLRLTDTVTRVDSVTKEVRVFVDRAVADTAIRSCTLARLTCAQRVVIGDSLNANLARQRDDLAGQLRAKGQKVWLERAAFVGLEVLTIWTLKR